MYQSEEVFKAEAAKDRKKNKRRNRILMFAGGIGATFLIPAGAWAFITLSGTGAAEAKAFQPKALTVTDAAFTQELFPGASTGLSFRVNNSNPFPVKVTDIAATEVNTFNGGGCPDGQNLSGFATQLNQNVPLGTAAKLVPANDSAVITLDKAVTLDEKATASCGFKITIKVTGLQQAPGGAAAPKP